jgi:hypothetical protein
MMKKETPAPEADIRPEYRREDLGKGVRGKYYEAYIEGTKAELPSGQAREQRRPRTD